ncbi:MAG: DUF1854 domain-containing protein [Dechloromonas sp.]|nr:DUF1854 domain-containing protein [Dechloromonas sp.]
MANVNFQLHCDNFGRLVLTDAHGIRHEGVTPVRAFPIAAPNEGLSLINFEGHEVGWVDHVADLPPGMREIVEADLRSREFVPEIERILDVSGFACPSTWQVQTNRGQAELVLKGEEDIRRLSQTRLLIADANGIQFLVRDLTTLDKHSRKLLDRFL